MKRVYNLFVVLGLLSMFSVGYLGAQETKAKVIIIEEYIDENGEKQQRKTVHEGESLEEMEEQIRESLPKGGIDFDSDPFGGKHLGPHSSRAWIGLRMEAADDGVIVQDVVSGSPAETAGIQSGDIIRAIDGESVVSPADVTELISEKEPYEVIALTVERDSKLEDFDIILGENKSPFGNWFGMDLYNNDFFSLDQQELLRQFGLPFDFPELEELEELEAFGFGPSSPRLGATVQNHEEDGVTVVKTDINSPAHKSGFQAGDIIIGMGSKEISSVEDVKAQLRDIEWGDQMEVRYLRDGESHTSTVSFDRNEKPRPQRLERL